MTEEQRQVVIYLDSPTGQLIQTTLYDYRNFWKKLGWKILDRPPELPLGYATVAGQQRSMM